MKKILILAYDFPPYVSVGGLRPYSWYKYMHQFGLHPVVVTRQWNNINGGPLDYISAGKTKDVIVEETEYGTLIQAPYHPNKSNRLLLKYGELKYKIVRKIIAGFYEFAQFVFPIGSKSELYFAAKEYLKKEKVDVIVATGDPFVLFKYASDLSKQFDVPWIADYRDPWSEDIAIQKYTLYKIWVAYFEKKIVIKADRITTVSDFLKIKIEKLTRVNKIDVLLNGFDSELTSAVVDTKQNDKVFSIAYIGTFYEWYPLESFLRVCLSFIKENTNVKFQINLYGINKEKEILVLISNKYKKLLPYVHVFPKEQNAGILKKLATNHAFLLFNNYSFLGTKIFDYMALKRKILLCYSNDEESLKLKTKHYLIEELDNASQNLQENMLKETQSGIVVKDEEHLKEVINRLYQEFLVNRKIECNSVKVEQYSRKIQTKKLISIINNL